MSRFRPVISIPAHPLALTRVSPLALAALAGCAVLMPAHAAEPLTLDTADSSGQVESAPAAASATSRTEEVVIQGQAAALNELTELHEVPESVSIVTEDDLAKFDASSITEVLRRLGNVRWNYGNPRTGSFSLRGVTASVGTDYIDPSVGITVDGISYAYPALAAGTNIFDVESVDVTRGPQGTEGAKSTSIGQINIKTREPSFTPEASAALTLGDYNAVKTQAVVGGPLIDNLLAWRISFQRDQQDGAYANDYPDLYGRTSYGNTDRTYARLQFLLTPTEDLRLRLLVDDQPKGSEYVNGLSFRKDTPDTYADGVAVNKTNTAYAKLSRDWFTQQSAYTADDYYSSPAYLDSNGAIITASKGALLDASWKRGNQTFQSLTSWRDHYFSAANDDGTPFDITKSGGYITSYQQLSQELSVSSKGNDLLDYKAGLWYLKQHYNSLSRTRYGSDAGAYNASVAQYATLNADAAGRLLLQDALNDLYVGTQSYVDNESTALFANLDWHLSRALTLTTGLRLTHEERSTLQGKSVLDAGDGSLLSAGTDAANNALALYYFGVADYASLTTTQQAQIAAAKALRSSTIGTLYGLAQATPYKGNLPTSQLSLSYAFNDDHTGYATWQHGSKGGISQLYVVGTTVASLPVKAESSNSFEVGVRSNFLDRALAVNADLFYDDIRNFQQTVYFYDALTTQLTNASSPVYTSAVGNVPRVVTQGLELDAVLNLADSFSVRFSGAYTDARYRDFQFMAKPSERGDEAVKYYDASGLTLPNAPKVQFSITPDFRLPVFNSKVFHTSASYSYTGRQNTDSSLSAYAWQKAYGLADFAIGLGTADGKYDVNVTVKNVFNELWGDAAWSTYTVYTQPRWAGVTFSAKFY
ncbi:MAG: TonB-dependent receptor [Steroidobacteraceae bacterium]